MPSPFPGMNPYLEQPDAWHDFHQSFMPLARDMIAKQIDPRYIVKIDEHIYVHEVSDQSRAFLGRGDVFVADQQLSATSGSAVQTIAAPAEGILPKVDVERFDYLEIYDRRQRQVVTVIELLSPTDKRRGLHRDEYLAKRQAVLASETHLVEIDLLRGGEPMPIDGVRPSDYRVIVSPYELRPRAGVWPFDLQDPLPQVPVPLHASDPPAQLDLQTVLHRIYDSARYEAYLYDEQPDPPLSDEQLAWARSLVFSSS